jgi:Tol biopolymer transport system component
MHGARKTLLFEQRDPVSQFDIWKLRLGEQQPVPVLQTRFNELRASVSPDGRWIAYMSDESGRFEVYVQPITGSGAKVPISTEGGMEPVWNRNGRELFYLNGPRLMAVDVSAGPRFSVTSPRLLFEGGFDETRQAVADSHLFDVTPDGRQFVMLKSDVAPATSFNVILNWFATLRGRVPNVP